MLSLLLRTSARSVVGASAARCAAPSALANLLEQDEAGVAAGNVLNHDAGIDGLARSRAVVGLSVVCTLPVFPIDRVPLRKILANSELRRGPRAQN